MWDDSPSRLHCNPILHSKYRAVPNGYILGVTQNYLSKVDRYFRLDSTLKAFHNTTLGRRCGAPRVDLEKHLENSFVSTAARMFLAVGHLRRTVLAHRSTVRACDS